MFKGYAVAHLMRWQTIDAFNTGEREILFAFSGHLHLTFDHITHLQCIVAHLILIDKDVIGRRHVVVIRRAEKACTLWGKFQHSTTFDNHLLHHWSLHHCPPLRAVQ